VGFLVAVMLLTIGKNASKRTVRKNFLALTIGLFMHLVFDGAFLNTNMFWWPVAGFSLEGYVAPFVERGFLNVPLEMLGIFLLLRTRKQIQPLLGK